VRAILINELGNEIAEFHAVAKQINGFADFDFKHHETATVGELHAPEFAARADAVGRDGMRDRMAVELDAGEDFAEQFTPAGGIERSAESVAERE
jgi:hypothetical protein